MSHICKKSTRVKIKSDGDVFHKLWKANPLQVPNLTPTNVQKCQLHEGEIGTVGSILVWNYFHDGKDNIVKTLVQDINEEKKSVTLKALEGNILELYKTFVLHIHVDADGLDNLVTWTVEYEKQKPNVPDPDTLLDFYKKVTKDIEAQHLKN